MGSSISTNFGNDEGSDVDIDVSDDLREDAPLNCVILAQGTGPLFWNKLAEVAHIYSLVNEHWKKVALLGPDEKGYIPAIVDGTRYQARDRSGKVLLELSYGDTNGTVVEIEYYSEVPSFVW